MSRMPRAVKRALFADNRQVERWASSRRGLRRWARALRWIARSRRAFEVRALQRGNQ